MKRNWSVIGIQPTTSLTELKDAYHKKAKLIHPDRNGKSEQFQALEFAYTSLKEALHTRQEVDKELGCLKQTQRDKDTFKQANEAVKQKEGTIERESEWCPETHEQCEARLFISIYLGNGVVYKRVPKTKTINFMMRCDYSFLREDKHECHGPPTYKDFIDALQAEVDFWLMKHGCWNGTAYGMLAKLLPYYAEMHRDPKARRLGIYALNELHRFQRMTAEERMKGLQVRKFRETFGIFERIAQ